MTASWLLLGFLMSVTAHSAAPKTSDDSFCVKNQLEIVYEYEKKFFTGHERYTADLQAAGVPRSVIEDCPTWSEPTARTTRDGLGFVVRSENPVAAVAWSVDDAKGYVRETLARRKRSTR